MTNIIERLQDTLYGPGIETIKPSGSDDTTILQEAIDDIEAQTGDRGGRINLMVGDYTITAPLVMKGSGILLSGVSPATEYGVANNEAATRIAWGGTTTSEITYMIDVGDTSSGSALTRRPAFENLSLDGRGYVSAMRFRLTPEGIIRGCSFNECQKGIFFEEVSSNVLGYSWSISDSIFHNFATVAIDCDRQMHRFGVSRNFFSGFNPYEPDACIRLGNQGHSSNVNIIGNNFEPLGDDGSKTIYYIDAKNVRALNIAGNYFEVPSATTVSGMMRLGGVSTAPVDGGMITGNYFVMPTNAPDYIDGKNCIELRTARDLFISGNHFLGFNGTYIYINEVLATDVEGCVIGPNYDDGTGTMVTAPKHAARFDRTSQIGKFGAAVRLAATDAADVVELLNSTGDGVELIAGAAAVGSSNAAFRPKIGTGEQYLGSSTRRWGRGYIDQLRMGAGEVLTTTGAGSPESSITAPVGSLYLRTDGGAGTTLYVKESGSGNTGWVAK